MTKKSIMNGVLLQQGVARLHNRDTSENISSEEEEWTDDDDSSLPQDAIKLSKKVPYSSSLSSEVSSKFGGEKLVINNNSKDNELEYSSDHGWLEEAEAAEYAKQKKKKKRKKKRKNKRRSRNKSQTGCPRPIFSQLSNSTATVMKKEEGEIPNLTISSVESEKKVPKIHVHIPPCRKNSVENSSSSEEEWDDSCENDNSSMASASSHLYHISYSPLSDVMSTPASSLLCVEDNTLRPYGIVLALSTSATLVVYPQTHHPSNIPRFEDEIQRVHRDERVILKIGRGQMVLFDGGLIHGGRGRGPAFPGAEFGIGPVAPIIPDEGPCVRAHFYLEPAQRKGVGQFGNPAAAVVGAPDLKGGAGVEFMNGTLPLDAAIPSYSRNRGGDVEQRQLHREVNMRGDQVIATCKNKECKKCALGAVNRFHTRYGAYTIVDSNDPGEFMVDCSQMHSRNGRPGYVAGDLRSEGWAVFDTCKKMIVTEEDLQQIPKNAWDKIFNEEKEFNYAVDRVKPPPSKFTLPSSPSHSTSTATEIIPKLVRPGRRMMCKLNPCLNHHVTKKRGRKLLDIQKHVERHIGDLGFNEYEMVVNDASLLMTEKWTADQRPHRDFSRYLLHGEG
uniref:Uncharacterized protein n=1 Tax=Corethron hystrix TaxID=216773 RepID=A0A7S1BP54_9STRA|mmetsp:Transcript_34044/g.78562  ORF Transcript_34044/g.78562 Transcript_34044/m.78562 type:complete len:615 (+) Transcript_34044:1334-3178(+)